MKLITFGREFGSGGRCDYYKEIPYNRINQDMRAYFCSILPDHRFGRAVQ